MKGVDFAGLFTTPLVVAKVCPATNSKVSAVIVQLYTLALYPDRFVGYHCALHECDVRCTMPGVGKIVTWALS